MKERNIVEGEACAVKKKMKQTIFGRVSNSRLVKY